MAGDLVSSKYPLSRYAASLLASLVPVANPTAPIFTNLDYPLGAVTDAAMAASGVCLAVAVPVDQGQIVSKISYFTGATAASTPTHSFVALYSGIATPALLAQSADATTTAIAAKGVVTVTLQTAQLITSTNAPNGFVYVSISQTGTAVSTAVSLGTPSGVNYAWTANSPTFLASTHGSAVGGTAPATIASPAAAANAPVVALT